MDPENPDIFQEALDALQAREVLPTTLRTAELDALDADLRNVSFFSAGVSKVEFLQTAKARIQNLLSNLSKAQGGISEAEARLELRQLAQSLGYGPGGVNAFGREQMPEEHGGLTDLTSAKRLNLILDTNVQMARSAGNYAIDQDPDILRATPCWELIRAGYAKVPRPWPEKWMQAARACGDQAASKVFSETGRMIARRDSPIWTLRLAEGGFNRFGNPYAPFDFGSHMRTIGVSRTEALRLGAIKPGDVSPQPQPTSISIASAIADGDLAGALVASLRSAGVDTSFEDGVLTLLSYGQNGGEN